MSKGGGQGSFAQMQEPGMGMDMGGFGGEPRQQIFNDQVMPVGNSQNFSSGIGGKGGQLAPLNQGPGSYMESELDLLARDPSIQPIASPQPMPRVGSQPMPIPMTGDGLASDITGFIPYSPDNASGGPDRTKIAGEGLLPQLQPINKPIARTQPAYQYPKVSSPYDFNPVEVFNNLGPDDIERLGNPRLSDILGSQQRFNVQTQGPESMPRPEELMRMNQVGETPRPEFNDVTQGPESFDRFSGGLGSKGGRSNPYQTDGIVPPTMRGQPLPGRRQFDFIDQPIARRDPAPQKTSRYTDAEHSAAEAQARAILGLPPKSSDTVYAGGTPDFDERTGQYRNRPKQDDMAYIGGTPGFDFDGRNSRYGTFMPQPMPRRQPPIFQPPTNFPFPMPPRMPPRMQYGQPSIPGMNTQFQMPSFGSTYGQMNPYAGQFSGYGVPSNIFSFAQPHYQPYVPQAYTPPPPAMQLPPGQGSDAFTAGFGGQGIGGFGRYNLGLARRQFGGR